jgi:hypothetical protein
MEHYAAAFTNVVKVITGKKVPEGDGLGFKTAMDSRAIYAWGLVNTILDNPRARKRAFMEYLYNYINSNFGLMYYTTFHGMYAALETCPSEEEFVSLLTLLRRTHTKKLVFESKIIGVVTQHNSDIRKIKGNGDYSRRYRRNLYNLLT